MGPASSVLGAPCMPRIFGLEVETLFWEFLRGRPHLAPLFGFRYNSHLKNQMLEPRCPPLNDYPWQDTSISSLAIEKSKYQELLAGEVNGEVQWPMAADSWDGHSSVPCWCSLAISCCFLLYLMCVWPLPPPPQSIHPSINQWEKPNQDRK